MGRPSGVRDQRVLVVEDDGSTARFLLRALERAGYQVTVAGDALAALAALAEQHHDVLLVDIGLPGASGFELVRSVQESHRRLPIALMTADASMDVAVRALRSEVDDFLAKPIEPAALVAQVDRLVELGIGRAGVDPERVLAVGAHPDDVEIGVGGILLAHRQSGDPVTVLTLSHGARGGDGPARAAEAARAAALLGARLVLEDLADTRIPEGDPTVGILERVIRDARPTVVYTHSLADLHQDHRNTHRAVMVAARQVPSVYCYESPSATVDFRPVRFVAVEAHMAGKLAAIAAYSSQTEVRSYLEPELISATGRYWGRYGASRYCEPLEVIRERPSQRSGGGRAAASRAGTAEAAAGA